MVTRYLRRAISHWKNWWWEISFGKTSRLKRRIDMHTKMQKTSSHVASICRKHSFSQISISWGKFFTFLLCSEFLFIWTIWIDNVPTFIGILFVFKNVSLSIKWKVTSNVICQENINAIFVFPKRNLWFFWEWLYWENSISCYSSCTQC